LKNSILSSLVIVCVVIILFGSGLLVGREIPRRHYERLPDTSFVFDDSTGAVCALFAPTTINVKTNPSSSIGSGLDFSDLYPTKTTIPQCGR
jgi:hypothetical protein